MTLKERYEIRKKELIGDQSICLSNRKLFAEFFEFQERKLKRINGLSRLDDGAYRTLAKYFFMLRNVNHWFDNRPWTELSRDDIKAVYDGLEDQKLKTLSGRIVKCRSDYYNRVLKSKPFRLAGKSELAKDVIEYYQKEKRQVRWISEETFKKLVSVLNKPNQLLLFWLHWDFGENINSILQLQKSDFTRQISRVTGEPEYLLHFRPEILKRSRRSRTEPTLHNQTVQYLDIVLKDRENDDKIFQFGYRHAVNILKGAAKKSNSICEPNGDIPSWKDFRSGMACYLLRQKWDRDEIKSRLGHRPSSNVIDAYADYLAIDKDNAKRKLFSTQVEKLTTELTHSQQRETKLGQKVDRLEIELHRLQTCVRKFLIGQGIALSP